MPTSNDHNFLVRSPFRAFVDSMESPLSLESIHIWSIQYELILCSKETKDSRYLSVLHVSRCSCETPTSDDHNFLVRSPFQVFLDSMESSLSLESDHMPVDGIWCSNIAELTSSGRADLLWSSRPRLGNELGSANFGRP